MRVSSGVCVCRLVAVLHQGSKGDRLKMSIRQGGEVQKDVVFIFRNTIRYSGGRNNTPLIPQEDTPPLW